MFDRFASLCAFGASYGPMIYNGYEAIKGTFAPTDVVQRSPQTITLQEILPDLFERVDGLRDDILVYNTQSSGIQASGSNYSPHSMIFIDQEFAQNPIFQYSVNFMVKHEVSHILNSDHLKSCLISGAASLIAALAVQFIKPYVKESAVPALYLLPSLTSSMVTTFQHRAMEVEADRFAVEMSSENDLQGGLFFFSTFVEANRRLHASYPTIVTEEGNLSFLVDQIHPLHTTRIEQILAELDRRGIAPQLGTAEDRQAAIEHHQNAVRRMFRLPEIAPANVPV